MYSILLLLLNQQQIQVLKVMYFKAHLDEQLWFIRLFRWPSINTATLKPHLWKMHPAQAKISSLNISSFIVSHPPFSSWLCWLLLCHIQTCLFSVQTQKGVPRVHGGDWGHRELRFHISWTQRQVQASPWFKSPRSWWKAVAAQLHPADAQWVLCSFHCEVADQKNLFHPQTHIYYVGNWEDLFLNQTVSDIPVYYVNFKSFSFSN